MEDRVKFGLAKERLTHTHTHTLLSSARRREDTWLSIMAQQLGDAVADMSLGKAKGWPPGDAGAPSNRFWPTSAGHMVVAAAAVGDTSKHMYVTEAVRCQCPTCGDG